MKKTFLYIVLFSITFTSCRKDTTTTPTYVEPENIATQNSYDDQSIQKFMGENYLDSFGNITPFSSTDASDDNYPSLLALNPVTLPSGVIYIKRTTAQPSPGTTIGSTDVIRLMHRTMTYLAADTDGKVAFISSAVFRSTIDGTGVPENDPSYYYTPTSVMNTYNTNNNTSYGQSFFQIEGFNEALQNFKAFDIPDSDYYNLQGVIIVPSRAAFARDNHFNYAGYSFRNRTFVFNFQIYKSTVRLP